MKRRIKLRPEMIERVSVGFGELLILKTKTGIEIGQTRAGFAGEEHDGWSHRCHSGCTSPNGCRDYALTAEPEFLAQMVTMATEQAEATRRLVNALPKRIPSQYGTQLWEPCKCCGTEPSYAVGIGHLCRKCIDRGEDHPRIPGPAVP